MTLEGSCHCGDVAFEVEGAPEKAMECNCSICAKKGYLLWFVPSAQVRMKTSDDALGTYKFNKGVIQHHFCTRCGVSPFGRGKGPDGSEMVAVNVRCLEGLDLSALEIQPFDGRSR